MADEDHTKPVIEDRARRAAERAEEAGRLLKYKNALKRRHSETNWPMDARTLDRAEVDPEDVQAPLEFDVKEITEEDLRAANEAADSTADHEVDPGVLAYRRAEFEQEKFERDRVVGPAWTDALVEARIEEAFKVLGRMSVGQLGPREFGNAMPQIVREHSDLVAQAGNRSLRKAMKRLLRNDGPPSGAEVARMNDALAWAVRYLKDRDPDEALFVNLGGMWKAWGAPVSRKCKEIGVHRQVFYRDRKSAVRAIVEGLIRDGRAPT